MATSLIRLPGCGHDCFPPGLHWLGFRELRSIFAFNQHREFLLSGLVRACRELRLAGCGRLFLGGSFVTAKPFPSDFDATWDPVGVISSKLDPVFYDPNLAEEQKRRFLGELFIGGIGSEMYNFLSLDKATGAERGIVGIKLSLSDIQNYD